MPTSAASAQGEKNGLQRRLRIEWLVTVPALMALTFLLSYFGQHFGMKRLDHLLYDRSMAMATHPPSEDIVIVALDDASIRELGYWPWRRSVHARLLERLEGAKAVGMDIVLSDPNPAYPDDDAALARAMREHGRVVLPLVLDQDSAQKPLSVLAEAASGMGYINAHMDADSVVRSMRLRQQASGAPVEHFVLAMLDAGSEAGRPARPRKLDDRPRLISYAGYPGSFTMYPYARVLDGSVPPSAFEGKYVLVGAWAAALGDTLSTPLSKSGEPMAGVEILANGLQNALENRWIHTPDRLQSALLSMLPVLLVCLALRRLSPRKSFFFMLIIVALIFIANWLSMRYADVWVDSSAALIGIVLAYPVWNWRMQEATLRQVGAELDQLYEQNLMQARLPSESGAAAGGASLPERMVKLHGAMGMLRQAIGQREEALRFLSHDMRSPQNAILALTQLQRYGKAPLAQPELLERIDRCASRTLGLVDGFVQLARAESTVLDFQDIDLGELLHSICDERWPMARRRRIVVAVDAASGTAHVMADGEMLGRALGNLVDNAIQYSPDGAQVLCRLYARAGRWVVAVKDQGRGMTAEQQARLFEPFRRFDVDAPGNPDGSGLGLALVRTVVLRHGGRIEVESARGKGSVFKVSLPGRPDSGALR